MSRVHRIVNTRAPRAHNDKPGTLLAASSFPEGGTVIVLDDFRVRTYYGETIEKFIDVAQAAGFWIAADLAPKPDGDGPGNVTPYEILARVEEALRGFTIDDALRENAELVRLVRAVSDARDVFNALLALLRPSAAIAQARSAIVARHGATDTKRNTVREMKRVLRALVKALKPFGEVTR